MIELTVIIPAHNEEEGLALVLAELMKRCGDYGWKVLVIDDCSSDRTFQVASSYGQTVDVLRNDVNLGYGASIKRGVLASESQWVATLDGDGQHRVEDLERLASQARGCDAVVGQRTNESHVKWSRLPGKMLLGKVVNLLVGQKIPDINCGLRIFRREALLSVLHLAADGFSFSTSTLVAMLKAGYHVIYTPVVAEARLGKSTVRQFKDGLQTILLILRLITLFDPLRVILPVGAGLFLAGLVYQVISIILIGWDINDLTVLLCTMGVVIFVLSLIADQTSSLRRELTIHGKTLTRRDHHSD